MRNHEGTRLLIFKTPLGGCRGSKNSLMAVMDARRCRLGCDTFRLV
jgi:hypothetical protein